MNRAVVLLLDGDGRRRSACIGALEAGGWRALATTSGTAALDLAFRLRPDAIVLAGWEPGGETEDTARALKADARTRGTLLIALGPRAAGRRRALAAGCDAFIPARAGSRRLLELIRSRA